MLRRLGSLGKDERGSALALVAVSLVAVLSVSALAIDLGRLYTAHAEAQRAADAAALAGASAYRDLGSKTLGEQAAEAKHRAKMFAQQNTIQKVAVDTTLIAATTYTDTTAEALVETNPTATVRTIRVTVHRKGLGMWFANLFGVGRAGVTASAVAQASAAGSGKCLVPLALPDTWNEQTPGSDANGNRTWDPGEDWSYDIGQDSYEGYTPSEGATESGYGSHWRDGQPNSLGQSFTQDFGRSLVIKPQNPQQDVVPSPGWFFPWRIGDSKGAKKYEENFYTCNPTEITLGNDYDLEMGNMVGPTIDAIDSLMAMDPKAAWTGDPDNPISGSVAGNWRDSPRVIKLAMFDPKELVEIANHWKDTGGGSSHTVKFNNFALLWLEGVQGNKNKDAAVVARFLYYAEGTSSGGEAGPLTLTIRLIK